MSQNTLLENRKLKSFKIFKIHFHPNFFYPIIFSITIWCIIKAWENPGDTGLYFLSRVLFEDDELFLLPTHFITSLSHSLTYSIWWDCIFQILSHFQICFPNKKWMMKMNADGGERWLHRENGSCRHIS